MNNIFFKCFAVLGLVLLAGVSFSADGEDVLEKKAQFIIDAALHIKLPNKEAESVYKIAVFGRGRHIRRLYETLKEKEPTLKIRGKSAEILHFRRVKNISPVDLLYVAGDSKIRLSDLTTRLSSRPYFIVTENFPFGTSAVNISTNEENELFFEIQETAIANKGGTINADLLKKTNRIVSEADWEAKFRGALSIIDQQRDVLSGKDSLIEVQEKTITVGDSVIQEQHKKIGQKKKIITAQKTVLVLVCLFLLLLSGLLFVLYRINKARKQAIEKIMTSINYAHRIQQVILPPMSLIAQSLNDFFILFKPKDIVSGDFYWFEKKEDVVFFSVADCTGHGVPGALLSIICSSALTKTVKEYNVSEPAKILDKANELFERRFSEGKDAGAEGMDLALCCLNLNTYKLAYAGSHNPLYYIRNNELHVVKANRQPIGRFERRVPYTNHTIDMQPGDCIYLFSDGFIDQFGGSEDKRFSTKRFKKQLLDVQEAPMARQKELLEDALMAWMGKQKQIDDICVMGVRL